MTPSGGEIARSSLTQLISRRMGGRVVAQATIYTVAGAAATGLSGVAKALLARQMTPDAFGSFSFTLSFATLAAGVFDFGLFMSAARRLARSSVDQRPELIGAALVASAPLAALASLTLFGLSFLVDSLFHVQAAQAIRVCSVLAWAWVFPLVGELLCKGAGRLWIYSVSNLIGSVVLVVMILGLLVTGAAFSTTLAFVLATLSMVVSMIYMWTWLWPRFRRIRTHVTSFTTDCRAWAFQMYIGRLFSVGTYNMDVLMVAWFSNARSTGYYSLAASLAGFMGIPILGLAAALFPRMAREPAIEKRWLVTAWGIGALGVLVVLLIVPPLIVFVFGKHYSPVGPLAIPLVIATGVRGVTTLYNTFLSAHARGRDIRNVALVLTISNLILNFALIPPFGATGAAWASLFALLVNYVALLIYYRRYVRGAVQNPALSPETSPTQAI